MFKATLVHVTSEKEVTLAYQKLLTTPSGMGAAHNSAAYRLHNPVTNENNESWQDDGDYGVGRHLINLMTRRNLTNRMVIVTRMYNWTRRGYKQFHAIEKALDVALQNDRGLQR